MYNRFLNLFLVNNGRVYDKLFIIIVNWCDYEELVKYVLLLGIKLILYDLVFEVSFFYNNIYM